MAMSITAAEVAARLGGARPAGEGWLCRCPAHADKDPSLWIADLAGGGLRVKCHAGCARENVAHTLRSMKLWPEPGARKRDNSEANKRDRDGQKIERVILPVPKDAPEIDWRKLGRDSPTRLFTYRNANGELTGHVARWDELGGTKKILPVSYVRLKNSATVWAFRGPPTPSDLYNLPELVLRPDAPVLIVEGEKAADAGKAKFPDHVVIAWRGGAGAVAKADLSPLEGRSVVLWPDADDAGVVAMGNVAQRLASVGAADVRQVTLPVDLPRKWDVADPPPEGIDLLALLGEAAPALTGGVSAAAADPEAATPLPNETGLRPLVVMADELLGLEVPPREMIVDPFIPSSSLSMIYGPRGTGKTWVSMSLAMAVARGENFLAYSVEKARIVLFIDGEMALADLQDRVRKLSAAPPPTLLILPSERLFQAARPINLHSEDDQQAILTLLDDLEAEGRRPEVIIFDNLSSLSGGVDENDNSALDHLLRWLIGLRHTGMAVILVHHSGKNGTQRGASRREDLLETVIALMPPPEDAVPHDGAHLVLTFPKTRGRKPDPETLELRLTENRGQLEWQFSNPVRADRATAILLLAWEHKPKTQAELAALAGVKEAAMSHQVKKLRMDGYLADGSPPTLTPTGRERLLEVWPELYEAMQKQGELALRDVV